MSGAWCPREDSNLYYKIRNLASYPLNDGDIFYFVILSESEGSCWYNAAPGFSRLPRQCKFGGQVTPRWLGVQNDKLLNFRSYFIKH